MNCQHCGHKETLVRETREMMGGAVLRRRRACADCGGTFNTYEIDGGIWGTVKKWALGSRMPALDKKHATRKRHGEIAAMVKDGRPLKEIAEHFGIATTTVCYAAKKAGLPSRRGPKRAKPASGLWHGLLKD